MNLPRDNSPAACCLATRPSAATEREPPHDRFTHRRGPPRFYDGRRARASSDLVADLLGRLQAYREAPIPSPEAIATRLELEAEAAVRWDRPFGCVIVQLDALRRRRAGARHRRPLARFARGRPARSATPFARTTSSATGAPTPDGRPPGDLDGRRSRRRRPHRLEARGAAGRARPQGRRSPLNARRRRSRLAHEHVLRRGHVDRGVPRILINRRERRSERLAFAANL